MLRIYYKDGTTDLVQSLREANPKKIVVDQEVFGGRKTYRSHTARILAAM